MAFLKPSFPRFEPDEMLSRSEGFLAYMNRRRSIRHFDDAPIEKEVLLNCIRAAGTAPSGANKQPWTFCLVEDPELRKKIRALAEAEEARNYASRMNEEWLKDLEPLGTDANKAFLEEAPFLVILFKQVYGIGPDGNKEQHYYVNESVGIVAGMFIAALHQAGLATLTHTPSPMNFLEKVLNRPANERAFLVLPVGVPHESALVPDIKRKELDAFFYRY